MIIFEKKNQKNFLEILPLGYQRKKVKFVWSPKGKNLKFFFSSIFKKKVSIAQNWKKVSIYDELELVWDELIILEKNLKKIWNSFLAIFRKKRSQIALNWKKMSIMMNLSLWIDNLGKKSEKNLKFFLAIFRKKGLKLLWIERKCPLWWIWAYLRWIDNFWKKIWKKSEFFF